MPFLIIRASKSLGNFMPFVCFSAISWHSRFSFFGIFYLPYQQLFKLISARCMPFLVHFSISLRVLSISWRVFLRFSKLDFLDLKQKGVRGNV